jgi:hypothetical protein
MKHRRETLVTAITIVVIAIAMVAAVIDTIETGRVYVFSRQFLEELPRRFTGPGRFRFLLQPTLAIVFGVRGGLADAKAGSPPYLFGLLFAGGHRREMLRDGAAAIRNLLAAGIIMDLLFQMVLYRSVHPGAALLIGPIFICGPYALSRALANRVAARPRSS